ncbi:uncharacterized protein K452DRAFT_340763 [Aplosporella prunicola CBS 121167]|uniref:Uncharacterized protein n=1 Tax=Aplosporella prunicola CBS 121167 TaxID=1176127 RepID=A0A6A6BQ84_9PEZI|nr:uncharacterized protein K452DRAFT_340763 [Aplosporella prunicola CBS 121167]KAF2146160.1 hypothetical protein K452DRAFT_340763 [Aplosporella prunicola CBS 121167]
MGGGVLEALEAALELLGGTRALLALRVLLVQPLNPLLAAHGAPLLHLGDGVLVDAEDDDEDGGGGADGGDDGLHGAVRHFVWMWLVWFGWFGLVGLGWLVGWLVGGLVGWVEWSVGGRRAR